MILNVLKKMSVSYGFSLQIDLEYLSTTCAMLANSDFFLFCYFIKTSFCLGYKLSVNTVFQCCPGVRKHEIKNRTIHKTYIFLLDIYTVFNPVGPKLCNRSKALLGAR